MNYAPMTVDLAAGNIAVAASTFVSAVEKTGMLLREDDVQAFLAALMTKPFAILTGLSGSGKTQLAKRLGEWFGSDSNGRPRYLVVPVRPDWTGPEYLFGYPDVLRSEGTEEVWAVPDALEFMLRAVKEKNEPFLLLLDEMNLAHVERYFADFLSGVESREPILPELELRNGRWTSIGNSQRLPLPRNLFVAGTVNVDETTYLFFPKCLTVHSHSNFALPPPSWTQRFDVQEPPPRPPANTALSSPGSQQTMTGTTTTRTQNKTYSWRTFGPCTRSSPLRGMNLGIACCMSRFAMRPCSAQWDSRVDLRYLIASSSQSFSPRCMEHAHALKNH